MKFYRDIVEAHPNSKIYDKCWDGYRKVPGKSRGEKGSCEKVDEFAPAGGGTPPRGPKTPGNDPWGGNGGAGDDPYSRPEPEYYSRSIDFFGKFEADHFDREDFDKKTGVFKGYWENNDGSFVQIAYFKFDNAQQAAQNFDDSPGMGWYYEPVDEGIEARLNTKYSIKNMLGDVKSLDRLSIEQLNKLMDYRAKIVGGKFRDQWGSGVTYDVKLDNGNWYIMHVIHMRGLLDAWLTDEENNKIPLSKVKPQSVAEGHADQQRKIFKKNGKPVGEVGIDRESSPGVGQWYMKCYAYNIDNSGYDSYEEAVAELKHCLKQGVAEGRFDEPLTGWHIVYRKSGNPVHATPSFETKDQAQKYLMTKMFANHQDYKVVHTARVGVAEAQSAKTGIYQTDVMGAKAYHAKCMEPNCDWESKRFDSIKQAQASAEKHAKGHFKQGVAEGSLEEFAPGGGDNGDDGFSEETLKRLAAQWYNGDEDPRVEQTLMAAGWEIGQDEGYDDEPGVFVVQAGDVNGHSFISWPANELRQGVAEVSDATLKSYQQKVSADSMKHSADPTKRSPEKASRSVAGFAKAHNRLETDSVTKKPQPYNDPDWAKKLSKDQLDALAGPKYKSDKKITKETQAVTDNSLGYKNTLAVMKAADSSQEATINLGGEPVTLDYPEARFIAGKYKAFLRAGRQEEFFGYMANPQQFDSMMKQLRNLIDKQKNFRGSVPGERGVPEGYSMDDLRKDAQAQLKKSIDSQSDARIAGKNNDDDEPFMSQVGRKIIGGVKGAVTGGVKGAWKGFTGMKEGGIDPNRHPQTRDYGRGEDYDKKHGSPYDRGGADSWYSRPRHPHKGGVGGDSGPRIEDLTPDEIKAYHAGYDENEKSGGKKQWESVQQGVAENLRLVGKHGEGAKTAKVYKDHEWGEYRVKFYTDGKHEGEEADYHTDDRDDANDTAKSWTTKGSKVAENTYWCRQEKTRKLIPEGYKLVPKGYIVRI